MLDKNKNCIAAFEFMSSETGPRTVTSTNADAVRAAAVLALRLFVRVPVVAHVAVRARAAVA